MLVERPRPRRRGRRSPTGSASAPGGSARAPASRRAPRPSPSRDRHDARRRPGCSPPRTGHSTSRSAAGSPRRWSPTTRRADRLTLVTSTEAAAGRLVIDVRRAAERFTTEADRHHDAALVLVRARTTTRPTSATRCSSRTTTTGSRRAAATTCTRTPTSRSSPGCSTGRLVHAGLRTGTRGVVAPGQVQRLSAGSGVRHSERNDAPGAAEPTRFVQMWVLPDEPGCAVVRPGAGRRRTG